MSPVDLSQSNKNSKDSTRMALILILSYASMLEMRECSTFSGSQMIVSLIIIRIKSRISLVRGRVLLPFSWPSCKTRVISNTLTKLQTIGRSSLRMAKNTSPLQMYFVTNAGYSSSKNLWTLNG